MFGFAVVGLKSLSPKHDGKNKQTCPPCTYDHIRQFTYIYIYMRIIYMQTSILESTGTGVAHHRFPSQLREAQEDLSDNTGFSQGVS